MKLERSILVGLLTAGTLVMALPAKDEALLQRVLLTSVRPMAGQTVLVRGRKGAARIVAPETGVWPALAQRLQGEVRDATGVELSIVSAATIPDDLWQTGSLVVLGNLLESKPFARLYGNFFVCADAGYTGDEGYELRTVHEPFGPGCNVVVLGAQAVAGAEAGMNRLIEIVRENAQQGELSLPRLLELHLQRQGARESLRSPLTEAQIATGKAFHDRVYARVGTERSAAHRVVRDAMRYHRTGDEGYLSLFRYGMESHMRYFAENEYINGKGLGRYDRNFRDSWTWAFVVAWDLLEEHPSWTDDERLRITNHVLRCVLECNVYQHWMGKEKVEQWRTFDSITHNHHTWPGLANLFGGWYFKRHYAHPFADDWLTIAKGMFNGCKHSAKPWEDSAGYQWIPMGHILTYTYASGDSTYIDEGHAALTTKTALMCLDSLGHQPAFGDHTSFTGNSRLPTMLSALGYATRDGACRWALDWLDAKWGGELQEPFHTNVKPRRPDELTGVAVSYLPSPHYALNGKNSQYFPKANVSFEESFDKLTLRAGWERTDDYLLLDGYSGGSHGHQDCNAIIGYTAAGAHWLVDGEYIRQTPKYHNMVTVVRDGEAIRNPAMARLDDAAWFGDAAICRTTIPDYNGVRWTRNLFWRPNGFVVVLDELTALTAGDYSLRCCWRVYGNPTLAGNRLTVEQGDAHFELQNLSGDNLELTRVKRIGNYPVSQLYQRRSCHLEPGESVTFVNVFRGAPTASDRMDTALCGDKRAMVSLPGKPAAVMGVGDFDAAGMKVSCAAWMADASGVRAVAAQECSVAGKSLWRTDDPCPVRTSGTRIVTGQPETTPHEGQRAVMRIDRTPRAKPLDLHVLTTPVEPSPPSVSSALDGVRRFSPRWSFSAFPRTPVPLPVQSVQTTPDPKSRFRPKERLFDGHVSNSKGSCMFPAGKSVVIDLDLGEAKDVTEVRVRAWEMSEDWQTTNRKVFTSVDGATWKPAEGTLEIIGTQRWGGNVNTIYGQSIDRKVRLIRFTADPAAPDRSVYVAEIEIVGSEEGVLPELTALASARFGKGGRTATVVGTGAGNIVALDGDGKQLWRVDVGGRVTVLAAADLNGGGRDAILYGGDSDHLGVVDAGGNSLAKVRIPQYRGIPSVVRNITVADLDGDAVPSIVVGVKSWQYLAYSPTLELEWKHVIYAHSATVAEVADLDGDGKLETVGGNAYYRMNIINSDGTGRLQAGRFGPEQTAVTSCDLTGNGKREVVFGTDGGDVLAFGLTGALLWESNVGDRVTSMCPRVMDGVPVVVTASESGFVTALDPKGAARWRLSLGEPVRRMIPFEGGFVCAASGAGVVRISSRGRVLAVAPTPAPVVDVVKLEHGCAAILTDGSVCGVW